MKNKSIEKLFNLIYTDSMTGMKNRAAFDELRKELNKYGNSLEKICAISVIFEDYDMVSRVFGNATCDDAIREIACCLTEVLGEKADIYRTAKNEFMCIARKSLFGEIVNVIGIQKEIIRTYKKDKFQVIYREGCKCKGLCDSLSIGVKAFQYFSRIYPAREMDEMNIIVLGNGDMGGAYIRNNMIVMGEPPEAEETAQMTEMRTYQLFAHELGHIWFCKADVTTFEDWLNETGAEWSQLLFLLEEGKEELFHQMMEWRYDEQRRVGEPIRPRDLHHPATVHTSGTVLFHMIYKKYGKEAVINILQILSRMEQQNTEDFLTNIETEYSVEIAEFIRNNLDEKIVV